MRCAARLRWRALRSTRPRPALIDHGAERHVRGAAATLVAMRRRSRATRVQPLLGASPVAARPSGARLRAAAACSVCRRIANPPSRRRAAERLCGC
jgi:hypothetical protein